MTVSPGRSTGSPAGPIIVVLPAFFRQEPNHRYKLTVEMSGAFRLARASDGFIAARLTSDLLLERARSVVIEDWQDTADLLASLDTLHLRSEQSRYSKSILKEAHRLFEIGRPEEAYRTAIRAEQLSLPAAFELPASGGPLTPFPISVESAGGPVRAVIKSFTDRSAIIEVHSRVAQTITIRMGGFEKRAAVLPDETAELVLGPGK